jgi:hypothetical protein
MRHLYYRWLVSPGMFVLIFILAACGGGSAGPTTGSNGNGSASPTTSTGNTTSTPTPVGTSTVSFTASGGLNGANVITVPIESNSNELITTSKNKTFKIQAIDNLMIFTLTVLPYTGPGSYTLSNKYFPDNSQNETLAVQSGQKVWGGYKRLSPTWTCPLTIASDTAATITVGGNPLAVHEIKGSFSCSMVLSALNTDPPISLSNGQFDVFVLHLLKESA